MSDGEVDRKAPANDSPGPGPSQGGPDERGGSDVTLRAREALASGRESLARDLLADRVAAAYDPEALILLGEVLYVMGDSAGAGCAWFGTPARGKQVSEAIQAWRETYAGDFARMWRSLPDPVRRHSRLPKVEALRSKAFPGLVAPDGASDSVATVRQTPVASAPVESSASAGTDEPGTSAGADEPGTSAEAGEPGTSAEVGERSAPATARVDRPAGSPGGPAVAARKPGGAARRDVPVARRVPEEPAQPSSSSSRVASPGAALPRPASKQSAPAPARRHGTGPGPAAPRPSSGQQGRAVDPGEARAGRESSGGFDAARIIAWALAVVFVFCAIVGLITILSWLVPGK